MVEKMELWSVELLVELLAEMLVVHLAKMKELESVDLLV